MKSETVGFACRQSPKKVFLDIIFTFHQGSLATVVGRRAIWAPPFGAVMILVAIRAVYKTKAPFSPRSRFEAPAVQAWFSFCPDQ